MLKESYLMIDSVAQRDNVFTRMDARIKVLLSLLTLAAVVGIPGFRMPAVVFAVAIIALLAIRVPGRLIIGRIAAPMMVGTVVFVLLTFFHEGGRMLSLEAAGIQMAVSVEGFLMGVAVLARIAGCAAVLLFLSVTTPVYELGYALIWLKVPRVLVEILLLTYRYLFVLWDEGTRIRQAQTLRLGYPRAARGIAGWKTWIKSTSTLMGMVLIRAYDRAENTFSAMQVRAYNGDISSAGYKSWTRNQTQYLVSSVLVVVGIIAASI